MFSDNLKRIMGLRCVNATTLSNNTGISKSSISQYMSGKNMPSKGKMRVLADALSCKVEDLLYVDDGEKTLAVDRDGDLLVNPDGEPVEVYNVPVTLVARLMHKNIQFVYMGLQQKAFPWGYAVRTSSQWSYFVSSVKFTEHTGIRVTREMIEEEAGVLSA